MVWLLASAFAPKSPKANQRPLPRPSASPKASFYILQFPQQGSSCFHWLQGCNFHQNYPQCHPLQKKTLRSSSFFPLASARERSLHTHPLEPAALGFPGGRRRTSSGLPWCAPVPSVLSVLTPILSFVAPLVAAARSRRPHPISAGRAPRRSPCSCAVRSFPATK